MPSGSNAVDLDKRWGGIGSPVTGNQSSSRNRIVDLAPITGEWPIQMSQQVFIIEWRYSGHRLAYGAAICRAAVADGRVVVLVTTGELVASTEFGIHLANIPDLRVEIWDELNKNLHRTVLKIARHIRRRRGMCVVPECDRLLLTLFLGWLTRSLPRPTSLIFMQPPKHTWRGIPAAVWSVVKPLLILGLTWSHQTVDVHLIEDPLAKRQDRVWRAPLSAPRNRLHDPSDLLGSDEAKLPPELTDTSETVPVIGVLGSIDDRKRLPEILEAWRCSQARNTARLVVAGTQYGSARDALVDLDPELRSSVTTIDRYLTNGEMYAVLRRCSCILVLYDSVISSGMLIAAAAAGRWVITAAGTRTQRVATAGGFGISSSIVPSALALAIDAAIASRTPPRSVTLTTSVEFGRRVLRRAGRNGHARG